MKKRCFVFHRDIATQDIPDSNVFVDGFQTLWTDRNCKESCKRKGGGLAIPVNNKWCNLGHIMIKECVRNPAIELLAVSVQPYYLPRDFSHAIVLVVYIPPLANTALATDIIHSSRHYRCQGQ